MSVSNTAALSLLLLMAGLAMATMDDPFESFPLGLRLESLQKRRGRELFGKRSGQCRIWETSSKNFIAGPMERQSRRTRELFGKRAAPGQLFLLLIMHHNSPPLMFRSV